MVLLVSMNTNKVLDFSIFLSNLHFLPALVLDVCNEIEVFSVLMCHIQLSVQLYDNHHKISPERSMNTDQGLYFSNFNMQPYTLSKSNNAAAVLQHSNKLVGVRMTT